MAEREIIVKFKLWIVLIGLALFSVIRVHAQEPTETPSPDAVAVSLADADGVFADVGGVRVYYLDRGPKDGQAVFLLHGFLGSVVDWTNTIPALVEAGYRVIAFDRPPFGLSDKRTSLDYSTKAMSELTLALMDVMGIEQAAVIGHSAGGQVAADFAVRYPDRVTKLVLVDGAVGITGPDMEQSGDPNPAAGAFGMLANLNPDNSLAQQLVHSFFNSDFAAALGNAAYADPTKNDPALMMLRMRGIQVPGWEGGLLAYSRDSLSESNVFDLESLRSVVLPVLLIWGEADEIVPIGVGERLKTLFPNVQWVTYPNVGHMPMDEVIEAFNADLVQFLGQPSSVN
jgi:pimeloyl-ACP methyl ester carboxylesterase